MKPRIGQVLGALGLTVVTAGAAIAQQQQPQRGTIVAQVISGETRSPVSGVQVFVVGSQIGGLTNQQGRVILLNVPTGSQTVRVQMLGYAADDRTVTVEAGGTATLEFTLRQEAISLPSVVVTALGIQREEKSLGYAVQSVGSKAIERTAEVQVVNALAGQTAGVQVTSSSGQPGASSRIVIRGESSFQGGGQPLWVVDGIPISTQVDSRGGNPLETGEMGGRGMDLDPNNIEEITVLRGAAATALYGSRAAFGAIVVRTKQGVPGARARFSVSSSAGMDVPILGGKQLLYAQGANGYFCNGRDRAQGGWCQPGYPGTNPNPISNNSWGPHRDSIPQIILDSIGDVRFRDPRKDFYNNGLVINNSINVSGSLPMGGYNFGLSKLDQKGMFPGTKLDRINLNANLTASLTSHLSAATSVMYSNAENLTSGEGYSSFTRTIYQLPVTRDISQAWMPDGSPVMWGSNSPHLEWLSQNELRSSTTARWIASQQLALTIVPGVTLSNRLGLDTYTDERLTTANERPWRTAAGQTSGSFSQDKIYRRQLDNNLTLNVDPKQLTPLGLEQFAVGGLVGVNVNANENSDIAISGSDIFAADNYNCVNFNTCSISTGSDLPQMQRLIGVYGQLSADYKNWAFLNLTGRNDWSSTLPLDNNSYFYPSASLAVVFTDALGIQDHPLLSYGKVRLSLSKVGSDAPPYRLATTYSTASGAAAANGSQQSACCSLSFPIPQQGGVNGYFQGNSLGNPELKPESTVEKEVGLELRFFNGRARTDVSYYDKKSYDQIFSVPASPSTGFSSITRNAGDLRNKGWEVSLFASPLRTQSFGWDMQVNWSRNRSSVLQLAEGVTSIYLAGYSWPQIRIMEGYEYGVIWGYGYLRDEQGRRLIDDSGWPILDDELQVLGETQIDWHGSLNTSFRFRNFAVSTLIERRQGGDMLNFELQYTIPPGQAKLTENRGDTYVFEGVNENTGQPNTVELERTEAFWRRFGAFDTHENMVEDATVTRIRELTLQYTLPRETAQRFHLQNLQVYATGRNLKIWTKNSNGDPAGSVYGSDNAGGQYYRFFPAPQTRGWYVGLRTAF